MEKTINVFLRDKDRESARNYCRSMGYRMRGHGGAVNPKTKRQEMVEIWVKDEVVK